MEKHTQDGGTGKKTSTIKPCDLRLETAKTNVEIEIFVTKMRIQALKQRVEDQLEFIRRCQAKQKSRSWKTQGLIPASTYNSLDRTTHKSKRKTRRKKDVWRNFFIWNDNTSSPHAVIKDSQKRIKKLESKLASLQKAGR